MVDYSVKKYPNYVDIVNVKDDCNTREGYLFSLPILFVGHEDKDFLRKIPDDKKEKEVARVDSDLNGPGYLMIEG